MLHVAQWPEGEARFEGYHVFVNGEKAPLFAARVSAMPYNTVWPGFQRPIDQTEIAPFLRVETDEALRLDIDYPVAPTEVTVRPLSRGVKAELNGCRARLTIEKAGQYTVEADGWHQALHLFVDPVNDFGVRKGDPNVLYFGPGVHRPGVVLLESGQTAYIDRDAVVYGCFAALDCDDVRVCGYGVIDGSWENRTTKDWLLLNDDERVLHTLGKQALLDKLAAKNVLWGGVRFYNCRKARLEGVTIRDSATFAVIPAGCDDVFIDRVKTIGMWRYNSDGIDIFNSADVTVQNCFLRDFDDCMVIKGIIGWDARNNERISVSGCVIWCDWGRALEIGAETCAPEYRDIRFIDCDIIHGTHVNMDIQHHNHALIHDIAFENIRLEYDKRFLPPVYQHDMTAPYVKPAFDGTPFPMVVEVVNMGLFNDVDYRNGAVRDIVFRDIRLVADDGVPSPYPRLTGLDSEHDVQNIVIDNMTLNGQRMTHPRLDANAFVSGVTVR